MTAKSKKAKRRKARSRPGKVIELEASVEDDLLWLAEEEGGAESRWNRPRKRRISLRVDTEVVDWFKSKGPGCAERPAGITNTMRAPFLRVFCEGRESEMQAPSAFGHGPEQIR
ncbi:MAG: BrnA antitoxin family protein [Candidatus Sulfotelmatobacter sp.]